VTTSGVPRYVCTVPRSRPMLSCESQQRLRRELADRQQHARRDRLELAVQEVRRARRDLVRQRVAVVRRPALQHVADVDLRSRGKPRCHQQQVEQPARTADERPARPVLFLTRRLADHHHVRRRTALAEHDMAPALVQPTERAARRFLAESTASRPCGGTPRGRSGLAGGPVTGGFLRMATATAVIPSRLRRPRSAICRGAGEQLAVHAHASSGSLTGRARTVPPTRDTWGVGSGSGQRSHSFLRACPAPDRAERRPPSSFDISGSSSSVTTPINEHDTVRIDVETGTFLIGGIQHDEVESLSVQLAARVVPAVSGLEREPDDARVRCAASRVTRSTSGAGSSGSASGASAFLILPATACAGRKSATAAAMTSTSAQSSAAPHGVGHVGRGLDTLERRARWRRDLCRAAISSTSAPRRHAAAAIA
jgi:hypothetical protein